MVPTFWGYFEGRQEEVVRGKLHDLVHDYPILKCMAEARCCCVRGFQGSWRWVYGAVREAVAFAAEASRIRRSLLQGLSQALELEVGEKRGRSRTVRYTQATERSDCPVSTSRRGGRLNRR